MTLPALQEIIDNTTKVFRKGPMEQTSQSGGVSVTHLFDYKHTNEAPSNDNYVKVDLTLVDILVNRSRATEYDAAFRNHLRANPYQSILMAGPSYMHFTQLFGIEQEGALRMMALGDALGIWNISNVAAGLGEDLEREAAENGFLFAIGYNL